MRKNDRKPQHDDETREVLRVAKRVSGRTGIPVKALAAIITRLVAAEQLKVEALDESQLKFGEADGDSPA